MSENKLIPSSFFLRNDPVQIAKDLLGKILISNVGGLVTSAIIVETEAYRAPDDLACHAKNNIRSPRTETMYALGGCAYVYICYGIHNLFNVVTGTKGNAHVVLVRGVEPVEGIETMLQRRKFTKVKPSLLNGPGKLTEAMGITKAHDGLRLDEVNSILQIMDGINSHEILAGPRVGMSHHTKECGHWPWRFRIAGNKWTSKPDMVKYDW